MAKVYISKNYRNPYTASSKAKLDGEAIVSRNGYRNIGLPNRTFQNEIAGRIWTMLSHLLAYLRMPKNGIVFMQYPVNMMLWQIKRAKQRGNKVVTLIHDLEYLRSQKCSELALLKESDYLIAHTASMKQWLIENRVGTDDSIVVLEIFDYLNNHSIEKRVKRFKHPEVAFAGNLGKSKFLNKLSFDRICLHLLGIGAEQLTLQQGLTYDGCFPPDELYKYLTADFGLVWDGDDTDCCSGTLGDYLKVISPHKLSMYLSLGIPVIVWSHSAMAEFVLRNRVGIAIDSLQELENILINKYSAADYDKLCEEAMNISQRLNSGYYLSTAINRVEAIINNL